MAFPISQIELIRLHKLFSAAAEEADGYREGHYEHLLLSLNKLIEEQGPTKEYNEWVTSASSNESYPQASPAR